MAAPERRPSEAKLILELREHLAQLVKLLPTLAPKASKKAMAELLDISDKIDEVRATLDPIKEPGSSFDPTNPDTAGRLVALALVAQERVPLARIARTYGSGVYAIYYVGSHPAYAAVSGSETPLYVGKADPKSPQAITSRAQGPQLYGRLADHRKMIETVGRHAIAHHLSDPLRVDDFNCRRLVCATNAQLVAERHLIATFKPVWNSEVGICWGISKHGDAATTRSNKRSPWDVIHPGRRWALAEQLEDKMTADFIERRIAEHFAANPPSKSRARVVRGFLSAFVQDAAIAPEASAEEVGRSTSAVHASYRS